MKRSAMPPRSGPIRRKARKPSDAERIYGSEAFRAHVHASPCLWCGRWGYVEQAHLWGNAGMGMKKDWTTTGPMCGSLAPHPSCHGRFDRRVTPHFTHNERAEILRRQKAFLESWMQSTTEPRQASV